MSVLDCLELKEIIFLNTKYNVLRLGMHSLLLLIST